MTTSRTTPKKKVETHFSLAAAEKETRDETPETPFTVDVGGGKTVRLVAPSSLDWKVASSLSEEEPFSFVRTVVHEDDLEAFLEVEATVGAMRKLMQGWKDYYSFDPGN